MSPAFLEPTRQRAGGKLPSSQQRIVDAARSHIGKPFSIRCRDGRATDCGGLVIDVARACGFRWADLPHKYELSTSAGLTLYVHLRTICDEVDPDQAQPGDLLLFWLRQRHHPQHLGIWCGESIVHASPMGERKVSERRLGSFKGHVFAAFQFRGRLRQPAHKVALNPYVSCERCVLDDPFKYARPVQGIACAGC